MSVLSSTSSGTGAAAGHDVVGRETVQGVDQVGVGRGEAPHEQGSSEPEEGAAGERELEAGHASAPSFSPCAARCALRAWRSRKRGSGLATAIRRIHSSVAT